MSTATSREGPRITVAGSGHARVSSSLSAASFAGGTPPAMSVLSPALHPSSTPTTTTASSLLSPLEGIGSAVNSNVGGNAGPSSGATTAPTGLVRATRRRQAAVEFDSDTGDENASFNVAAAAAAHDRYDSKVNPTGPELRDHYRQCFMSLPCGVFHTFVLVATFLLLAVSLLDGSLTQAGWYQGLEGVIIVIFATEVLSRWYIARSHFFVSRVNVIEAVICLVCVVTFVVMVVTSHLQPQERGGRRREHEAVMGMRYLAQLLRIGIFYKSGWRTVEDLAASPGTIRNGHSAPGTIVTSVVSTPTPTYGQSEREGNPLALTPGMSSGGSCRAYHMNATVGPLHRIELQPIAAAVSL
jgi:hypothetical protein